MSYDVYWVKNRAEKITDFEHPTCKGSFNIPSFYSCPYRARLSVNTLYPGRCPGLWRYWAFSPHCMSFDTPSTK